MTPLYERVILQTMLGGEANSYPIQLLVNYWEIRPSMIGVRLDELIRQGISHIATFVPWQVVESDISHSLTRLLLAASEKKVTVSLILTPEVGVHFPFSGLPKDIVLRQEIMAKHSENGSVMANLPPNRFALPSVSAPEFTKRYYSFLARMDGLLADFSRTYGKSLDSVHVILSGSLWKYYRSPRQSVEHPFQGVSGDFSSAAMLEYRHRVEYFYSHPEFSDPNPAAANRWKTRAMEDVNQRWFNQQSEAVFRQRTFHQVRRKAMAAPVREIELFTPEADPGLAYLHFLQTVSGGHGDFARLSALIDESATFAAMGASSAAESFIHWSSLGSFRSLSDSEKQFLILKSLLVMGGMGGGIFVDEEEWSSLSRNFRSRAEAFARSISQGELSLFGRALYLTPHLWSNAGPLWSYLSQKLGYEARKISSLDVLASESEASLLIVDPSFIMTREVIQKLTAWARGGRVLVLPRTELYTEMARSEFELILEQDHRAGRTHRMDIDLGVRYRLHNLGEGKVIIHELPRGLSNPNEAVQAWQMFLTALLGLAGIEEYCRLSDGRLTTIPLWMRNAQTLGLFVINETRRQIAVDVIFPKQVMVSDLAVAVSAASHIEPTKSQIPAHRFTLEVPPNGVMPLQVEGLSLETTRERLAAGLTADSFRESARMAAISELSGIDQSVFDEDLSPSEGLESWN